MTSIKEALERIKRTALDAKPEDVPKALAHIVRLCIDADRTTVESGDARERIARIIHPVGFEENSMERVEVVAAYQKEALAKADAILATGLVSDEAAVRADEREKCAKVADEHSFGREIDWWLNATKKDVAAETCRSIAAAIRSGGAK